MYNKRGIAARRGIVALLSVGSALLSSLRTSALAADTLTVTRASLAKTASFTVTQTLAAKGSPAYVRVYKIVVKGAYARVDYDDPSTGALSYIANAKGLFLYLPSNRTAMKQAMSGGVEEALQKAFSQAGGKMAGASKVGSAIVSGQPTDIYKDQKTGSTVYVGKNPGFRLPVKFEQMNAGGTTSFVVTDIRLNGTVSDSIFALPPGTQIMDSSDSEDPSGKVKSGAKSR